MEFKYPESNAHSSLSGFVPLADDETIQDASRLLCLRLWHTEAINSSWRADDVRGFWASLVGPFQADAAGVVAQSIGDTEVRQLTLLTLAECNHPDSVVDDWLGVSWLPALRPLALVAVARHEYDMARRKELMDEGCRAADDGLDAALSEIEAGEFARAAMDMDFLLEFANRAQAAGLVEASAWSSTLVQRLLTFRPGLAVVFIPRLCNRFVTHSDDEREAVARLCRYWQTAIDDLAAHPPSQHGRSLVLSDIARQCADALSFVARNLLWLRDPRAGEAIFSARQYIDLVTDSWTRRSSRLNLLRVLLDASAEVGWSAAIVQSMHSEDALLHCAERFGSALVSLETGTPNIANRLMETIEWSDRLMAL